VLELESLPRTEIEERKTTPCMEIMLRSLLMGWASGGSLCRKL
jgi:hypothetical protein